jgi:hypothetical protein
VKCSARSDLRVAGDSKGCDVIIRSVEPRLWETQ